MFVITSLLTTTSCALKDYHCLWTQEESRRERKTHTFKKSSSPSMQMEHDLSTPGAAYSTYVTHRPMTQSLQLLALSLFFIQTPLCHTHKARLTHTLRQTEKGNQIHKDSRHQGAVTCDLWITLVTEEHPSAAPHIYFCKGVLYLCVCIY